MTRRLALAFVPVLLLAACGEKPPATVNESVSDTGLEQVNVVAGDVTAIDAATADDARMADDLPPPALDGNDAFPANNSSSGNNAA